MQRRIAVIEKEKCNPQGCGGYLCIRVSPGNRMGKEVFVVGPDGKAQVNEDVCTDAESITVKKCPFGAIHMVKLPEKLTEKPVHRFGVDGFELFSLPVPLFGQVNGILGINGIGKSTAVKVIAQMLQPNFGLSVAGKADSGKNPVDKLIQMFRGSEAQVFFEKVRDGKITVSVKPQAVDAIPKTFKGTAQQLLHSVCRDDRKIAAVAGELGIGDVLETDISKVSGGELQRTAIAAAVLKNDTNVYLFDEPTSYLDIKQRIGISSFIRKLAKPETAVVAVEHDLIILDYLADSVHIMYGESGAYGMAAQPKPARAAINTYLEGYIREDNMRFRQHEIKFEAKPPQKIISKESLVKWDSIGKKLGRFSLTAAAGELPKKHVIGVIGENGLGKTSFVKILAGEIKPDSGSIHIGMRPMGHSANGGIVSASVKISYKPQYIHAIEKADEQVTNILAKAQNDSQLMARLELEPLLLKKVSELSGGELQRVMIAKCLAEDADLYLLDEPSAYLDVEQRIAVSKLLRERIEMHGKTALVVDHDLLLIDYVADMIMVFEGQPAGAGEAHGPFTMEDGMNHFLKSLNITLRRDKDSNRPRINSPGSRLEREQKAEGKYYYS
ncbi:ribosome biogenesis/translation initiation ATPase RLI [Candidatus Woesearchaeota archaeon]|nr:ribosome biogenesis/translation initiation ATPase RLI [Candidatus Woesearchaeota archaeon]